MSRFSEWSIENKLTAIIMGITAIALLSASFALIRHNQQKMRDAAAQHIEVIANIIGANIAPALLADNSETASATLQALRTERHVTAACIFKKSGTPLAVYVQKEVSSDSVPKAPLPEGFQWGEGKVSLSRSVTRL